LQVALLPKDAADERSAMIEIRPGTGGDEAALFAADLLRMYQRFSESSGWKFEVIEEQLSELGGIKEVVVHIKGHGVFENSNMKVVYIESNAFQKLKVGVEYIRLLQQLLFFLKLKM
jgi:protein subunit release factor A